MAFTRLGLILQPDWHLDASEEQVAALWADAIRPPRLLETAVPVAVFLDQLFSLADVWCCSVDPGEVAGFLAVLYQLLVHERRSSNSTAPVTRLRYLGDLSCITTGEPSTLLASGAMTRDRPHAVVPSGRPATNEVCVGKNRHSTHPGTATWGGDVAPSRFAGAGMGGGIIRNESIVPFEPMETVGV